MCCGVLLVCLILPRVVGCQPTASQLHCPFISLVCPLTFCFSSLRALSLLSIHPQKALLVLRSRTKDLLTLTTLDRPQFLPPSSNSTSFFHLLPRPYPTSIQSFSPSLSDFIFSSPVERSLGRWRDQPHSILYSLSCIRYLTADKLYDHRSTTSLNSSSPLRLLSVIRRVYGNSHSFVLKRTETGFGRIGKNPDTSLRCAHFIPKKRLYQEKLESKPTSINGRPRLRTRG